MPPIHVRRDYKRPLFSSRRRRVIGPLGLLLYSIALTGAVYLVSINLEGLQTAAAAAFSGPVPPTPFAAERATEGLDLFLSGDLEGARESLTAAVAQQPQRIDYRYELGRVLLELGRDDEAIAQADAIIAQDAGDVRGHSLRANALKWSDPAAAIQDALRGVDVDPTFAPLHAALATAYTNIARYTQALEAAQRAIELDPNDATGYRAYAYPLVLVGRWPEAIENLETAVSLAPNLVNPYFELAAEYKNRADDPKAAVDIYMHIIENMNPSPADEAKAYLRICETLANVPEAEFDKAEPFCRTAIDIQPEYGSAYRELGRMQYNRRNYEGAIESFNTCATFQADASFKDIECWALRGLAHYWMAQCDDAWVVLNEALTIADAQGTAQSIVDTINTGIFNVTQACPDYRSVPTPTPIPPTPIPATPIGSL